MNLCKIVCDCQVIVLCTHVHLSCFCIYRVSVFVMVLNKPYSLSLTFPTTCPLYAVGLSDPCKSIDCKKGEQCIVVEPNPDECKDKNNCRPHAKCIAPQKDGTLADWSIFVFKILAPVYTSNSACSTVRCAGDTICQETESGPACVPANAPSLSSGCAKVLCAQGYNCVDSPSGPSCQEFQNSEGITIDESQTPAPPSGHMLGTSDSGSGTEVQTGSATDIDLSCSMECPPGI